MPSAELRAALEALNEEIEQTEATDDETAQHMDQLQTDVTTSIEKIDDRDHHVTLGERLELAVETFDAEHPKLSQRIREVVAALSNAGL